MPEIPALPEGDWEREERDEETYVLSIAEISKEELDQYIDLLTAEGYEVVSSTEQTSAGVFYLWNAQKEVDGIHLDITMEHGGFAGTGCYVTVMMYE